MRVRDLGPMLVDRADGPVPCARGRQAAILATLCFHVGHRVGIDELVVGAWGYDATVSRASVENHVWRLRKLLDPAYSRTSVSPLRNEGAGYLLMLPTDDLDSTRFADLAERSRDAWSTGDAPETVRLCELALPLWRGTPYDDIAHVSDTASGVAGLEQLRGELAERRIDALLRLDRIDQALADVDRLIAAAPFREHLWAQRMIGLTRRGRTDEALQTYRRLRSLLLDELGLEPGSEVAALHQRILTGDLSSDVDPSGPPPVVQTPEAGTPVAVRRGPVTGLPRTSALFGRGDELAALSAAITPDTVVTVVGPGGTGKTRLAIEAARGATDRFTDGVFYVDLTQVVAPDQVTAAVITTVGLAGGGDVPTLLRAHLSERAALLVLDNCEHVLDAAADLVAALTGLGSASAVLVTSREPLNVPDERVSPLGPLPLIPDASLPHGASAAAAFFLSRATVVPQDSADLALVEQICAGLDGLPLALELAAARTRSFGLPEIAAQVVDDPTRLARIGRGTSTHHTSLAAAIDRSHQLLPPSEQAVHQRLSALPGPFTLPVATAVAQGSDLGVADVPTALAGLVHRSMLVRIPGTTRAAATTFRQLDTVRAHARHQLDAAGATAATVARRDGWVLRQLRHRPRPGSPAEIAWFDAVDDAWPAVRATLHSLLDGPLDLDVLRAAMELGYFWYYRARLVEARSWLTPVLDRCADQWPDGEEPPAATLARLTLAALLLVTGEPDGARSQLDHAVPRLTRLPDDLVPLGASLVDMVATSGWAADEFAITARMITPLTEMLDRMTDVVLRLHLDKLHCVVGMQSRPLEATVELAMSLYDRAVVLDDLLVQWQASAIVSAIGVIRSDIPLARQWGDRLIALQLRFGRGSDPGLIEGQAILAALEGDFEEAARLFSAARTEGRRVGIASPDPVRSAPVFALTRESLPAETFDRCWAEGAALTLSDAARRRGLLVAPGATGR